MAEKFPCSMRAHANCCPLPSINDDKSTKRVGGEIVFFDLENLLSEKSSAKEHLEQVYNSTQLPPPPPEMPQRTRIKLQEKRERIVSEEKAIAKNVEKRLKDISRTYCIDIPPMAYNDQKRPSTRVKEVDRLPAIDHKPHNSAQPRAQRPKYKGSRFRATMEDRRKNSHSYEEFVGRLSYLINLSRKKVCALYGDDALNLVSEFLGKSRGNSAVFEHTKEVDKMAPFRQRQFCISSTVRKILAKENV